MDKIDKIIFKRMDSAEQTLEELADVNLIGANNGWGKSSVADILDSHYFGGSAGKHLHYYNLFSGGGVFSGDDPGCAGDAAGEQSQRYHFGRDSFSSESGTACAREFLTIAQNDVKTSGGKLNSIAEEAPKKLTYSIKKAAVVKDRSIELENNRDVDETIKRLSGERQKAGVAKEELEKQEKELTELTAWVGCYKAKDEQEQAQKAVNGYPDSVKNYEQGDYKTAAGLAAEIDAAENGGSEDSLRQLTAKYGSIAVNTDFSGVDDPEGKIASLNAKVIRYAEDGKLARDIQTARDNADKARKALYGGRDGDEIRKYTEEDARELAGKTRRYLEAKAVSAARKDVKGSLEALGKTSFDLQDAPVFSKGPLTAVAIALAVLGLAAAAASALGTAVTHLIIAAAILFAAAVIILVAAPAPISDKAGNQYREYMNKKRSDFFRDLENRLHGYCEEEKLPAADEDPAAEEFTVLSLVEYNRLVDEYQKQLDSKQTLKADIEEAFGVFGKAPDERDFAASVAALQTDHTNWTDRGRLLKQIRDAETDINAKKARLNALFAKYGLEGDPGQKLELLKGLDEQNKKYAAALGVLATKTELYNTCLAGRNKDVDPGSGQAAEERIGELREALAGSREAKEELNKTIVRNGDSIKALTTESSQEKIKEKNNALAELRMNDGLSRVKDCVKYVAMQKIKSIFSERAENLLEPASRILRQITGNDSVRILLDNGVFSLSENGIIKPFEKLSDGTKAQAILAYRLANIEDNEKKSGAEFPYPLILDEAFGECDDGRTDALCKAVLDIARSQGRQVFCFTCKEGEFEKIKEYFEKNGAGDLLHTYDRFERKGA